MNRSEARRRLWSQREPSAVIWAVIRDLGNYAISSVIRIRPCVAATSTAPALALARITWSLVRWTAKASLLVLFSVILRSKQCLFHKLVLNVDVRMELDVALFQLIWMLLVLNISSKLLLMIKVVLELLIWLSKTFCTSVEVIIGIHLIEIVWLLYTVILSWLIANAPILQAYWVCCSTLTWSISGILFAQNLVVLILMT